MARIKVSGIRIEENFQTYILLKLWIFQSTFNKAQDIAQLASFWLISETLYAQYV